nr:MAG TPA: hypothetical protein [Caudoviricetes sp.]
MFFSRGKILPLPFDPKYQQKVCGMIVPKSSKNIFSPMLLYMFKTPTCN